MSQENTLKLLVVAMAALVIPAAEAVVLNIRSFLDLPIEAQVLFVISMICFAVLLYYYLLVPFWTWLKIWLSGR